MVAVVAGAVKNNIKPILIGITSLFIMILIFVIIKKVVSKANLIGGIVVDAGTDKVIENKTGVPAETVSKIRKDAHSLAFQLQTLKGMSLIDRMKNVHIQFDADTLKCFKNVTSKNAMLVFKNTYENEFTENNTLINDLRATLSASNLQGLQFIEAIY